MEEEPTGMRIGARLRAARERLGLTREALAVQSGLSWSAIAQVEASRRTNLRPATLIALSRALGVSVDYLVSGQSPRLAMAEHLALLYGGDDELCATALPYLTGAVRRSEPALAVTSAHNIGVLREALDGSAAHVTFVDRQQWYRSPAAALAGYREFVDRQLDEGATWIHVLGEPVSNCASAVDRCSWARYESLLNLVFGASPVSVLCAYDTRECAPESIEHTWATHPQVVQDQAVATSAEYVDPASFVLQS